MNLGFFQYDPESKRQSMQWKSPSSPRRKKACQSKSIFKPMVIVFFDIWGNVHMDWVPKDQTVNQVYYKEFLTNLCERVRRRRSEMRKNSSWGLHQYDALARFWRSTKSPCWNVHRAHPALAPCDFFLFPRIKSALKGTRFKFVDAVKAKAMELMNKLSEDDLQHCFQQWKICMERCKDQGGEYIGDDNIPIG